MVTRRKYTAEFKDQVVLEMLREHKRAAYPPSKAKVGWNGGWAAIGITLCTTPKPRGGTA